MLQAAQIAAGILHGTKCIAAYDFRQHTPVEHVLLRKGGKSSVPWYVSFSCTPNAIGGDILCSPVQEFFCLDTETWVQAYQLDAGRILLGYDAPKVITYIQWIQKELEVHAIELDSPHTYFVGCDSVLTHNNSINASCNIDIVTSCILSSTAVATCTTAAVSPALAPATMVAGLVVTGLLRACARLFFGDIVSSYTSNTPHSNAASELYITPHTCTGQFLPQQAEVSAAYYPSWLPFESMCKIIFW